MYASLAVVITLGCCCYASVTDLRERKIRNIASWGLLYAGVTLQTIFWILGEIPVSYLATVLLGGGALAFLAHLLHFAAPGDAKLFWAATVALPASLFQSPQGYLFPPLVLAINTFVPYLVGLLLFAFLRTDRRVKLQAIRSAMAPKAILTNLFNLSGFIGVGILVSFVTSKTATYLSITVGPVVNFLLILLAYQLAASWAKARRLDAVVPLMGVSVCVVAFIAQGFFVPEGSRQSLLLLGGIYVGVYSILRPLILLLAEPILIKEVEIAALEVGMIPAEEIRRVGDEPRYVKVAPTQPMIEDSSVFVRASRPLDTPTVEALREAGRLGRFAEIENRLRVQKTIPFAPFIALGVALTVLAKGPIYALLRR